MPLSGAFDGASRAIRRYAVGADRLLTTTATQVQQAAYLGDVFEIYYHGGSVANGGGGDELAVGASKFFYGKTPSDKLIGIFLIGFKGNSNNLNYYVYATGAGVNIGDPIAVRNINQFAGVTRASGSLFNEATRNANPLGPEINWDFQPGSTSVGNRSSGGGVVEEGFRIYGPDTEFVIELRNQSTTDALTNYRLNYQFIEAPLGLLT